MIVIGRPFFKAFHTFFDYEALTLSVGTSPKLVGTLRDLNPPAILDHHIFFILIAIAVVLVLGAGAICYCTFTKRNNLLEDKLAEEHQKYMKLARGENPENW